MSNEESDFDGENPILRNSSVMFTFQARGACLSLYNYFFNQRCVHSGMKSERLHHVYVFLKLTLQEHVLDIHMVQMTSFCYRNRKQDTDGHHLRNRGECLIIINVVLLRVELCYLSGLVSVDGTIDVVLDFVHPLASSRFHTLRGVNQVPGFAVSECVYLFLHRVTLVCVLCCFYVALQLTHFRHPRHVRIMMRHVLVAFEPHHGVLMAGRSAQSLLCPF